MSNDYYLSKLHEEVLSIVDFLDSVCKKNEINYYITAGSLLGAIRHRGFIPWDDDFDVVMPREDYIKFSQIINTMECNDFEFVDMNTQKRYPWFFGKLVKKNTLVVSNMPYYNSDISSGLYIDIFPIDETNGKIDELSKRKKTIVTLLHLRNRKIFGKGLNTKTLVSHLFSFGMINKMIKRQYRFSSNGLLYYTNFGSQYSVQRQTMPKEWYDEGVRIRFEDREYNAPEQYTKVLESIYGPNYMQLPPVEKRRSHYPKMVRFSDGEEMYFDEVEHKVTVEESLE